ncbi:patatin-like phospholipase family protein [Bacteroides sp. 224]|uniref:patatin-like phospholipase family protein n=1 Tax=Bacteroides sp. 224 TaxID=2302936 RepID=UPI0013D285AF|nr:patatin-like phospholipase family protein [Bacteroides sp. 224]NDV64425.1 patatin [Bacteroides sp. 224]
MKKVLLTILFFLLQIPTLHAQKVGLVLSGGGAKGMTHIGIIRALEENNIPIDYITGTSMGAIIGSMYAMGYSPDEMAELISSEDFKRWYTAVVEEDYRYYFKSNRQTPEFFNIRMSLKDSLNLKPQILPTHIVNPIQMNLVFIQLFASATAACQGSFDNLFVPFRCVAADVYNKKQLILGNGDLGDAVRASMSFPFVFKPIPIDGVLAYDGGIYNNFPVDIMQDEFNPDIIIGSVVAKNPPKPKEDDLMSQIDNMVMQKTDYTMADSLGVLLTFKYTDVTLLDFHRLEELEKIGYDKTMSMMDSIKSRIPRRVNADNIRLRRMVYRSSYPELRFKNLYIEGANSQQQSYIKKEFRESENEIFDYEDIKRAYFRLLSDNIISEIIPKAVYKKEEDIFDLYLKVKMEHKFSLKFGGSVSTTSSNQIYVGLSYQDLNYYSKEFMLDGQIGKVYNNAQFMAKVDFPTSIPTSYRLIASLTTFDYFKNDKIFGRNKPAFNRKDERFIKLYLALPFLSSKRADFSIGLAEFKDRYFQNNVINFEEDKYDKNSYMLFGGSISINGSTLNSRQYATRGYREFLTAQIYTGKEKYIPGLTTLDPSLPFKKHHAWLQLSYLREDYHKISSKFTLGSYVQALYASKNFSENYTATLLQAGEFAPTPYSQLTYNEAFRANQFVSAGIKPIYHLNDLFHLRGEFYGFMPIYPIERNSLSNAYYGKAFSKFEYIGEVSVICQLPFGTIAAYLNHFSSPAKEWNVGLTIGWQLFNNRFIDY